MIFSKKENLSSDRMGTFLCIFLANWVYSCPTGSVQTERAGGPLLGCSFCLCLCVSFFFLFFAIGRPLRLLLHRFLNIKQTSAFVDTHTHTYTLTLPAADTLPIAPYRLEPSTGRRIRRHRVGRELISVDRGRATAQIRADIPSPQVSPP